MAAGRLSGRSCFVDSNPERIDVSAAFSDGYTDSVPCIPGVSVIQFLFHLIHRIKEPVHGHPRTQQRKPAGVPADHMPP